MSAIHWIPLLFVAVGVVLLVAASAVWHRGQRTRACLRALLDLPDDLHPMLWPAQAQAVLEAAGIMGLRWEGQWFGDAVQGQWGQAVSPQWPGKSLDAGTDCQIQMTWAALARTDEARALALAVVDVFAQAWLARMRAHTQAVAVALAQRAHVQLYWQHDMRNLAQWVGILAEEFEEATPEQLPRLARRLQQQAPLVLQRTHRLLAATATGMAAGAGAMSHTGKAPTDASSSVPPQVSTPALDTATAAAWSDRTPRTHPSLLSVVQEAALLAGLPLVCQQEGVAGALSSTPALASDEALIAPPCVHERTAQALERSLDNVLSNIARDSQARVTLPALCWLWRVEAGVLWADLKTPRLCTPWPERPFEPLQLPERSGLGLYQARRSLRDVGGDLQAEAQADGVVFRWQVPLV
jgi:hypothetical protein